MSTHVMVDLETMGNGNEAAIVAIGAVKFDPMGSGVLDAFYAPVDLESSVAVGLKMEAATVMWWLHGDRDRARKELLRATTVLHVGDALHGFAEWFGPESLPVWGNGATFDNVILDTAFKKVGVPKPWNYSHDRCFRTFKNLAPGVTVQRAGTHHQALDDAETQARHMQAIVKHLGLAL